MLDARLEEYLPEADVPPDGSIDLDARLPDEPERLGEIAGHLIATGCDEASDLETADLVVINTCAIREAAEQKVIGRMGQLASSRPPTPPCAWCSTELLGLATDWAGIGAATRRWTSSDT